jgi:hypothetical protein
MAGAAKKSHPAAFKKGQSGNPAGRTPGTPNKTTTLLKEAILMAAEGAGGEAGLVGYLKRQAAENPGPFMSLLGKVLPMQIEGGVDGKIVIEVVERLSTPYLPAMKTIEHETAP